MPRFVTRSLAAAAVFSLLAACNPYGPQTVGQPVDAAVANAKSGAEDVKRATDGAANAVAAAAADATITAKINAALAADDNLKVTRIDVDTQNGRVVLTGTVPDAASRERATSTARDVAGVVQVDNRLTVSGN